MNNEPSPVPDLPPMPTLRQKPAVVYPQLASTLASGSIPRSLNIAAENSSKTQQRWGKAVLATSVALLVSSFCSPVNRR